MSGRRDSYSFELVDPFTLRETGETLDVIDGESTFTWAEDAENGYLATLRLARSTTKDRLVRVRHAVKLPDGTERQETLGTLFVDDMDADALFGAVDRSVACYSTLARLTMDSLSTDFVRPAGSLVVDEVRNLVETDGGTLLTLPGADLARAHTVSVWFTVGTPKADVARQLADWTGHELGVDADGRVTWGPYVPPDSRSVSYEFVEGENCTYLPGYHYSDTRGETYNRVVAYFSRSSKQDDPEKEGYDPYPLTDSATVDIPAAWVGSYERTGRRKTLVLEVGDPCSHADLVAQAERKLYQSCWSYEIYEIEHVGIPGLRAGDKVHYLNSRDGTIVIDAYCVVSEISMTLGPGAKCRTKLRTVDA